MSKLFIIVFIYGSLILHYHCYANVDSEREETLREREGNDFYDGHSNDVGDNRSDGTPDDEGRPRESDEDDDAYDDFQRDAEVPANEDDDEPIGHSFYKKEMMDAMYYGRRADPGCSWSWGYCSRGCCLKSFKCRDCRKKLFLLCGAYLFPPKQGKRLATALRPTSDQSDWMKKHKSKRLRDIVLPGSHHSGIYKKPNWHNKWDIPQTMSVANQLKAGVRFMDVRVATGPLLSRPYVVHAFKYQNFQKLIASIVQFLKKHKNEVVIMRLKKGDGFVPKWSVNWKNVDSVLQNYADYIYTRWSPLGKKLSELGGKMIICQERRESSFKKLTCKGSWVSTHTNNPAKLPSKMTEWLDQGKQSWMFNYLEAICTAKKVDVFGIGCKRDGDKALYRFHNIKEMASECNYKVYEWLKEKMMVVSKKLNAVMMDFVNPHILDYIINSN